MFLKFSKRIGNSEKSIQKINYKEIKYIATEKERKTAIRVLQSVRGKYAPIAIKAADMMQNGVVNGEEFESYSAYVAGLMF